MTINNNNLQLILSNLRNYNYVKLLIVTKNQKIEDIYDLVSRGFYCFGENRVQEAKLKYDKLIEDNSNIRLHLIGPLQRNKIKDALKIFNIIQTIDRISLVDEISKKIENSNNIKTKEFYIQVNIGNESQKSGVKKENIQKLYNYSLKKNLNITGLMCIPPNTNDPSIYFSEMLDIRNKINKNLKLSMGMSNDFQTALKFQTDMIRIGSMIFQ